MSERCAAGAVRCRPALAFLIAGLSLLASACGTSSRKPLYPVRGQVLFHGRPAARAIVTFHPVGAAPDEPRPSAHTDDRGYFNLTSYARGDGAPEGDYAVTVAWFRSLPVRNPSEGDPTTRNVLPPRYANPATSRLKATVAQGQNELSPIVVDPR
jgi:hypothetical protein